MIIRLNDLELLVWLSGMHFRAAIFYATFGSDRRKYSRVQS